MANEEEVNRLAGELQLQQSRGEAIRRQLDQMQSIVLEIGSAIEAIKNLKKVKGETIVPIGAGVFIVCPKPDPEKVIINIGANVMVHKKPDDAIKLLEERQAGMGKAITAAQEDLTEVVKSIERLSESANLMVAEESKNVRPPEK